MTGNSKTISSLKDYFIDFNIERGAALGIKDNVISSFYPVKNTSNERYSFIPSFDDLNDAANFFGKNGCEFIGIIHSHSVSKNGISSNKPSKDDIEFYRSFKKANPGFECLLFPIISLINNEKVIVWYLFIDDELKEIEVIY